ncbi:MAG: polymer-forming cytoskeletal protein [Thermoplasmatales archaeon]|nr:MAG: polymer-forming cytoskeletal protein [Thermoplasmatales archaeon]
MTFDRKTLIIPDKTCFEERVISTNGDVVIGDRCLLQFGVKTNGRIFVGEHVMAGGDLHATNDVRVDIFSEISGDIQSGGNVYLGEKVKVKGKLSLRGDLDVGDSVKIENGFEAKGWINIRSPIPVVIYIFIYLLQLLKVGHSEEIERILEELEQNDGETIPISETFFFIPNNSIIGVSKSQIDCNLSVGKECKVLGNYDTKGNIYVDDRSNVYGTLNSKGGIVCGEKVKIQGNVVANGDVNIGGQTYVVGNVSGDKIFLSKTASVQGTLLAKNGISFIDSSEKNATDKVKRFESDVDIVDELKEILE